MLKERYANNSGILPSHTILVQACSLLVQGYVTELVLVHYMCGWHWLRHLKCVIGLHVRTGMDLSRSDGIASVNASHNLVVV
jgi:hypothetical protein